ncbi:MAG: RNA polymerase sigma factor [Patescibacteria group bacterium]|nr:RNA polymerase sigma factor [Patescibacteria group bacterium]
MAISAEQQIETELVEASRAGNQEAFSGLYDLYIKKIYNFIYYKTLNRVVAEDICSEVFIKVWQKLWQFKSGNFSAWLYTIARHKIADHYRREQQYFNIDDCWDLADKHDFLEQIDNGLNFDKVRVALSALKKEEREILIMRFWMDLSFKEIAKQLDKNEGSIKMSCGRALKKIKNNMPLAIFMIVPGLINIWKSVN